jgi:hypothetical protein
MMQTEVEHVQHKLTKSFEVVHNHSYLNYAGFITSVFAANETLCDSCMIS